MSVFVIGFRMVHDDMQLLLNNRPLYSHYELLLFIAFVDQASIKATKEQGDRLAIGVNPYTPLEFADIKRMHAEIVAKAAARKGRCRESVARHTENDAILLQV